MKLSVPLVNGQLDDRYGKHATGADVKNGYPITSFPFTIEDAPAGTVSFALWFLDYDAVPVGGLPWIHWNAANIPASVTKIPAGASHHDLVPMIEGKNATAGHLVGNTDPFTREGYVGPQPPDKDHDYTLIVFALDTKLPLQPGFWLNEARHAMKGHILAQAEVDLTSRV